MFIAAQLAVSPLSPDLPRAPIKSQKLKEI